MTFGEKIFFCEVGSNNEKAPKGKIDKAPKIMNHHLDDSSLDRMNQPKPKRRFEGMMISENCDWPSSDSNPRFLKIFRLF